MRERVAGVVWAKYVLTASVIHKLLFPYFSPRFQ